MKWVYYIYWIWYALLLSVEVYGITIPVDYAKAFLCLYYVNFAFPSMAIFGMRYTEDLVFSGKYALAISISVLIRLLFFICEMYGFDDKIYLMVLSFFVISISVIFEKLVKRKLESIETDLL